MKYAILAALFMVSCASKVNLDTKPPSTIKPGSPEIIFAYGSDPIPDQTIRYIVKNTNKMCLEKGYEGVIKLILLYRADIKSTKVLYKCYVTIEEEIFKEVYL